MRTLRPSVYLAGAITGMSYEATVAWRERVEQEIAYYADVYSPMRRKEYLSQEQQIDGSPQAYNGQILSTPKGIVGRDTFDIRSVDVLLVNLLGAKRVSIGTVAEIGYAYAHHKPMVVVMEADNIHQHPFIAEMSTYIVATVEEGIELVKTLLLP